ncbi:hypothetical protein M409DRAFT_20140 [Zasmidium cellare ATCC 36951]|uniref:NAD dependent epimerase/dehydratase n=1 Tax=Zasmidium cellare ATCC 36951 TaxID=1080233 RepID=A0A6A6CRM3_ZASCE|nr:uncharacterized protein M409DRAFT_20140 [Zasmidium cellare ATCC 36951]KAF2169725.1 hypothetical protein M409DRAFT_20140 [Zasmidium cellare ATCC 36951]
MASTKNPLHRLFGIHAPKHGDSSHDERDSNVNLQLISLGLPRTGTTSLQEALIKLGFGPCHGGVELLRSPAQTARYHDIYTRLIAHKTQAGDPDLNAQIHKSMQGFRSSTDTPLAFLVAETIAAYPNAKFILTVRPDGPKGWWTSIWNTSSWHWRTDWLRTVFRTLIYPVSFLRRVDDKVLLIREICLQRYGCWDEGTYERHNALVRALVPPERLLEFDVRQGWGPLCGFLGVEIPEGVEFPRLNERESMVSLYLGFMLFGGFVWCCYAVFVGGAVAVAVWPGLLERAVEGVRGWMVGVW